MRNKITIKDVAKYANVSVATVSRVINNKGYVYEETRKSVLNAIKELKFEPNILARSLTNKHSNLIGIFVPHLGTNFYGGIIEGIEQASLKYNYKTFICDIQNSADLERDYLSLIEQYNIEGLVVASNPFYPEELASLNIPIVSIDHVISDNIPSISSDNFNGGKLAAKKFKSTGAKNILLLRGPSFLLTSKERTNGFLSEYENVKDVKISMLDTNLLNPELDVIEKEIKSNNYDAIFALSDTLALAVIGVLSRMGKKIPDEVQIIGFDDAPFAKWTSPTITSINQSIHQIGAFALETLNTLINDEEVSNMKPTIDVELVERQTTK